MADHEEIAPEELEGGEAEGDEEIEATKIEAIARKVKETEEELENLRKIQEQTIEEHMPGEGGGEADDDAAAEADSRSIHVGQVDYSATPEELQEHFAGCGTVNRVTILCDKYRNPKGFAYIEFSEAEAVDSAVQLNDSEFKGRQLKVTAKRTNVHNFGGRGKGGRGKGGGSAGKGKGKGGYKGGYKGGGYKGGYKGGPWFRPKSGRGFRPY